MFLHNLKIAFRNILKYKTQSVISILGLAIGFTAFAFTMSWIRYEMGYDSHNPDADRIYCVVKVNDKEIGGIQKKTPEPLPYYLESSFPEIEAATTAETQIRTYFYNNGKDSIPKCNILRTDTSFFNVFYPDIIVRFPEPIPQNAYLLSENIASRHNIPQDGLLGTTPDKSHYGNVPFNIIFIGKRRNIAEDNCLWCGYSSITYIRLRKGADVQALAKKLEHIEVEGSYQGIMSYKLIPLREVHYTIPDEKANIKFNHLKIFASISLLVIFCALFNYLMLFINHIKMRSRELALRKVNAAGNAQLMGLLFAEFLIILLFSMFIGGILTEILFPQFIKLSMIDAPKSFFISEMLFYAGAVVLVSLLISWIPVRAIMTRSIRENIHPEIKSFSVIRNSFTLSSLAVQLVIAILLVFCTSIFLYQYYYLNQSDIGFDRHNINSVYNYEKEFEIAEIRQIPGIEDVLIFPGGILPRSGRGSFGVDEFDNKKFPDIISFEVFNPQFPNFIPFFNIRILEGRNINEGETGVCLINQSAKKALESDNPIGKKLSDWTIVGIIPDLCIDSPLLPVYPSIYKPTEDEGSVSIAGGASFVYRFVPGSRFQTEKSLEALTVKKEIINGIHLSNMDDVYAEYTKSERYLLILLSIMTAVAILIAIFGIYSMITLSCSQRRKEIAIRKVNGARMKEILALFARQYFVVTLLACIAAFPIGIYVMQRWLEQYTRRVSMEWWIFAGIVLLVGLIVFASIFFRVYRAAKENPAEVVKGE